MRALYKCFFILFSIAIFSSCEKVPPFGERNIPPIDTVGVDNGGGDTLPYQQKNVLIEEFTGVSCNNCPKAANEIKILEGLFPGRIVAVGIHASNFAIPSSDYPDDFRVQAGLDLYTFTQPFGVPSGLIDRLDEGQPTFAKPFLNFGSETQRILQQDTADIKIETSYTYEASNGDLSVNVTFTNQKALSNNPNLHWVSYVTENKIIAPQKLPDNSKDPDYEHNHVLRATGSGAFGTSLANLGNTEGATVTESDVIQIQSGWVVNNCDLIIFVYDQNTYEVIQAVKTKLQD